MSAFITDWVFVDDEEWDELERVAVEANLALLLEKPGTGLVRTVGLTAGLADAMIVAAVLDLDDDGGVKDQQLVIVGTVIRVEENTFRQGWAIVELPESWRE